MSSMRNVAIIASLMEFLLCGHRSMASPNPRPCPTSSCPPRHRAYTASPAGYCRLAGVRASSGGKQEAEVALGENFPLFLLHGGRHPIALGFGPQVYARFSLRDSQTALISHDWVVGVNATGDFAPWDATLQVYHESSHLGDEYGDRFSTERLDWSREVLSAMGRLHPTGPGASPEISATRFSTSSGCRVPRRPPPWTSPAGATIDCRTAECGRRPVSTSLPTPRPHGG